MVYDITSPESFEKAKYWISELQKNASGSIGGQSARLHGASQHKLEGCHAMGAASSLSFVTAYLRAFCIDIRMIAVAVSC